MGNKFAKVLAEIPNRIYIISYIIGYALQIGYAVYRVISYQNMIGSALFIISIILQIIIVGWITGMLFIVIIGMLKMFVKNMKKM